MDKDIDDIIADIMLEAEEGDDVERRILKPYNKHWKRWRNAMNDKKIQAIGEIFYALITCALVVMFTLIVIDGWSSSDYDICQQRASWEATGHDYVGIPPGAENCAIN